MSTDFEISFIASSDPAAGARNKSADGSTFQLLLEEPISIPRNAKNVRVEAPDALVWWVIANIQTGVNDHFKIDHLAVTYNVFVPQGLYDLSALQASLDRILIQAGAPAGLFTLNPDPPTQKVELVINQAGTQIDFTPADTMRDILGFNSQLIPAGGPSVGVFIQLADNQAFFNLINFFLIHSDIVQRGVRFNNTFNQTISQVLIDKPPGSQLTSTPFNPPKSPADELIGTTRKTIKFWLTDQNNNLVNTNNENWSVRLAIKYILSEE